MLLVEKKREGSPHLSPREKKIEFQERIYSFFGLSETSEFFCQAFFDLRFVPPQLRIHNNFTRNFTRSLP
jgi:hypothetical protein